MMTISNPGDPSLISHEGFRERVIKLKALLVLSTFLCFTITLTSQNSDANSAQNLEQFKIEWMNAHNLNALTPAKYEQMKSDWSVSLKQVRSVKLEDGEPFDAAREQQYENWKGKDFPSGFPVMELTGDAEKDNAIYDAKKQQWIDKYPKMYQKMISNNTEMTQAEKQERINVLNQK